MRPPADKRSAMCCGVDASRQPADDGDACAGQAGGQAFSLHQSVVRGVSRADDGNGQCVLRQDRPADEEDAGRIVDFAEHGRIGRVAFGEDPDVLGRAQIEFGLYVNFVFGHSDAAC